jgi:hypothetical protein
VYDPQSETQLNPKYLKWNSGSIYRVSIHPFNQNLIKLNSIIMPKRILNVANGAELAG